MELNLETDATKQSLKQHKTWFIHFDQITEPEPPDLESLK
jgi:hypothetical protein